MVVSETQVQVQKITPEPISTININIKVYKDNGFYWADVNIDDVIKWTFGPEDIGVSYKKALEGLLYAIQNLFDMRQEIWTWRYHKYEDILWNLIKTLVSVKAFLNQKE
jgi:hypothetical protein